MAFGLAVVTGGGSGIGRAICKKLAENSARIVCVDRSLDAASGTIKELPNHQQHVAVACDVSQRSGVSSLVRSLDGVPSILVNCAGITRDTTLLKMKDEQFDDVLSVNLRGVYLMCQELARVAVANNSPLSIVNISSIVGKMGNFGQCNYAASKAGVIGFTKSAARELATKGIRVNAILPGFIGTPMTKEMPPDILNRIVGMVPMGRMGQPEEIADAALFLVSPQSSYITGTTLEVTGGLGM